MALFYCSGLGNHPADDIRRLFARLLLEEMACRLVAKRRSKQTGLYHTNPSAA